MISEVDLNDWEWGEPTELWKVPRDSYVKTEDEHQIVAKFHHVDGMYSFCHDLQGELCHLLAWAMVRPRINYQMELFNE